MSSSSKSPKPMTSETAPMISEAVHEGDNALDDSIMHCLWDRTARWLGLPPGSRLDPTVTIKTLSFPCLGSCDPDDR